MPVLYYFLNLIITSWTLLPGLTGLCYHLPLSKKLIAANLIKDEKLLITINHKRIIIFLTIYTLFIFVSWYYIGIETLMSTVVNLILCTVYERRKIIGKDISVQKSFLDANENYFKNIDEVAMFIIKK